MDLEIGNSIEMKGFISILGFRSIVSNNSLLTEGDLGKKTAVARSVRTSEKMAFFST